MGWAVGEDTYLTCDAGLESYANTFKWYSIENETAPQEVVSIQRKDELPIIYVNVGQADFDRSTGIIGCEAITDAGAGVWIKISSLTLRNNDIYFKNSGGTTLRALRIVNESVSDGGGGGEEPEATGICATNTYTSNVEGYAIHAQVTKGVNKYYLTLTSATEGKTLTELVGDNFFCNRYSEEARTHVNGYHMAVAGRYSIAEGAITFTIPSVGDPQMYTPINVRFNDNTACEITGLNGVRLQPCSTEDPVPYDPAPTVITDVNFAAIANGAVAYASDGDPWQAIDNNTGSRWETAASDPQWFVVDLGQRRIFNTVQIRWEGAYGSSFTIDVSNDASSWTTVKTVTDQELAGFPYEQTLDIAETTARFVRFNGTARGTGYGYSFWEFRVINATTPVLTTYTASLPSPFCTLGSNYQVTVTAKDQIGNDFPVENTFSVSPVGAGTITAAGVYTPSVAGAATITAEGGGMNSSITVYNEVSANLALNQPATAGHDNANAFKSNNADTGDRWGSNGATHPEGDWWYVDLGAKYDISEIAIKWETARPNDYDIRVSDDASSWTNIGTFDSYPVANDYEIYNSLSAIPGRYVGVWARDGYESLAYGISMYDFQVFGTENVSSNKYVSASASPAAGGSVSVQAAGVDVTEVPNGTEVTFSATPNSGYDFVNWTNGGVEVSTSSTYVTTITTSTSLVANFEVERTAYCSTPVTDVQNSRTLYLTISRTENENEYKILFEGSAENKITGDNVYVGTNLALTNVNGESSYAFTQASGEWHVSSEGFGSAYITFTATDYRNISFVNKGVDLYRDMSGGGGDLTSFNAFPNANLIKWDATCADAEAPDLAAPTATPIGPKSVRLELAATDDMAALLTYHINYKPTGDEGDGTNVVVAGTSGETTYKNITGLTSGVDFTFSITVSDGTNTSEPQSCSATPTMPTAPVPPVRPEMYVRSIYSDAYATILAADFGKKSFASNELTWEEMNVNDNNCLFYDLLPHEANAAFAIGGLNPGDIFVAQEAYQGDITEKDNRTTPDVSAMTHLHVDVWSNKATQYSEVQINGFKVGGIPLDGSGWQQFDLPLETFKASHLADLKDVKYINFVGLRTPNPEEIAIDNVYFYAVPTNISFADDSETNTTTIADNANKFANVTINRNISADGTWYTLCLPFDMDADKVSEVFGASTIATLVSSEERGSLIHLNFNYVDAIAAGKPYLIKPGTSFVSGSTISNVQIKNVDPSATPQKAEAEHMHFQGTFDKIVLTGEDKRYVSANNELYSPNPNGGSNIRAFRCYFTIPSGSLAPGRVAKIVFGEQTATGIDQMGVDAKSNGKLLINGVLYIIRDGKTYNAQGILIQ